MRRYRDENPMMGRDLKGRGMQRWRDDKEGYIMYERWGVENERAECGGRRKGWDSFEGGFGLKKTQGDAKFPRFPADPCADHLPDCDRFHAALYENTKRNIDDEEKT
jgi:hypothetical protein